MLTLYYAKGSCSSAVLMTAKSLGIDLKLVNVDIPTGLLEDGSEFKKINPKGYVPALQLDNGEVITEVVAICAYVSTLKGANDIFPLSGKAMVDQLQWFNYTATEIHQTMTPLFMKAFGAPVADENVAAARGRLTIRYQFAEDALAKQSYVTGSHATSADFYLFMTLCWADVVGFSIENFKALSAFKARMQSEKVVQEVLA